MSRKFLYLIGFLSFTFSFSQQNSEFREVKEFYDYQRSMLTDAFKKEAAKPQNIPQLPRMQEDFAEFMQKMDSIQNVAMLAALIRVKNREDLANIGKNVPVVSKVSEQQPATSQEKEVPAQYPGGMDALRQQVAAMFYFDALLSEVQKVSAEIYFVVEKDGSISSVKADGSNAVFNRQAEIAVYLLPERFTPATMGGEKVRYRFRVPLSMKFD